MKNTELIKKLTPVAQKNLGKTFFTLFLMVILESLCSAVVVASMYFLNEQKVLLYCALFAGIFLWFLILIGFGVMLLRMARGKFVTLGYLFYGFRRFRQFGPVALVHTVLTALSVFVSVLVLLALKKADSDILTVLTQRYGENSPMIFTVGLSVLVFLLLQLPQIFLAFLRYDNPNKPVFLLSLESTLTFFRKFFKLFGFVFLAGGRNLFLAAFYFAVTLAISGKEDSMVVQIFSVLFDFLYFINIYKAVSLMALSLPVFYEDLLAGDEPEGE